jgi:hypothetical protein
MKKRRSRVTNQALLIELLHTQASIEAHLSTLFMMQSELFAHLNKSESPPIVKQWGEVRMDFLKQNLADLSERFHKLAREG